MDESDPSRQYRSNLDLPDSANTFVCFQYFPDGFETASVKGRLRQKKTLLRFFSNLPKSLVPTPVRLARATCRSGSRLDLVLQSYQLKVTS